MADTVRRLDYFAIQVPDKPGEGARILQGLKEQGVNLVAFTGFPSGKRARFRAARLPMSGDPKNTMRPGGKPSAAPISNNFKITRPPKLCPTKCKVSARKAFKNLPSASALVLTLHFTDA